MNGKLLFNIEFELINIYLRAFILDSLNKLYILYLIIYANKLSIKIRPFYVI